MKQEIGIFRVPERIARSPPVRRRARNRFRAGPAGVFIAEQSPANSAMPTPMSRFGLDGGDSGLDLRFGEDPREHEREQLGQGPGEHTGFRTPSPGGDVTVPLVARQVRDGDTRTCAIVLATAPQDVVSSVLVVHPGARDGARGNPV